MFKLDNLNLFILCVAALLANVIVYGHEAYLDHVELVQAVTALGAN